MTAVAPLSHSSDENAGNQKMYRRMTVMHNGQPVEVPIVTGNSLRGQLRRIIARRTLELVGLAQVPLPVYHTLFSGGALNKGDMHHAHRVTLLREIRSAVPAIGLLGGVLHGAITPGSLSVDQIIPVCAETAIITGVPSETPAHALLSTNMATRRDQSVSDPHAKPADQSASDDSVQMIYETEILNPGTQLVGGFWLRRATELEAACLRDAVESWLEDPRLGGMLQVGMGRVRAEIDLSQLPSTDLYRSYMTSNAKEVAAWITKISE